MKLVEIGEIKRAKEIGYRGGNEYIWQACIDCGKERWVQLVRGEPKNLRCRSCMARQRIGSLNNHWEGGRFLNQASGYIFIYRPEHPRANNKGYVKRARLVLEEKLGRYLLPTEDSHHINRVKDDDRPENLEALTRSEHNRIRNLVSMGAKDYL